MSQNLNSTDKTFRRYAAIEGANHPPVHPGFVHSAPTGDAIKPGDTPTVTVVAATDLFTTTGHGLLADTPIRFTTTTTLPAGLSLATAYYVIASGLTADDFKVSATAGGSALDITSTGTGTHKWQRYLSAAQQDVVDRWFINRTANRDVDPVALLTINAWLAYELNPKHQAWLINDDLQRKAQWIWLWADHMDAAQSVVPPSASVSGTGSGALSAPPAASTN